MKSESTHEFIAFQDSNRVASGALSLVAEVVKRLHDAGASGVLLIFRAATSEVVDVDYSGTLKEVLARLEPDQPVVEDARPSESPGPGRPRLGVVAREVTLLPRHWEWLSGQSGGASASLRRLVEEARRQSESADRVKRAQEITYRFMNTLGGDLPGFEEAIRSLYRQNFQSFSALLATWPKDLRDHILQVSTGAFHKTPQDAAL
ncbi:DUF2239 family protein [Myxococcota bacterium]|nr:DUF2239 family protein [Myxococcota bacterium]MBU1533695.1 DUF2239 family protein [Myxococcota bacterium]